ncbi:MAG: CPBP family intramembrane metalloprotease [Verrucomicrobiota bacterium]|nr:CPBP family intramembrane metalloprotease [Verrucomicrobiota bacterium]
MLSERPWRLDVALWFCAAQLVSLCLGVTLAGLLHNSGVAGFQAPDGPGAVLVSSLAFQGVGWGLIWIFLRLHRVRWRDALGMHGPQLRRAWLPVLLVTGVILPLAWLLQAASAQALTRLGWHPENEIAVTVVTNARTWWLRAYLGVFTVVIAPVTEEFIFRGLLYPLVKQLGWPRLAWFGVSLLFALIHGDAAAFAPLFALALALTWLYEFTDTLLAPISVHALFNAVNLAALYLLQHQHDLS